jgi:hypothetical protein
MEAVKKKRFSEAIVPVLIVGAVWGIFEATVGYLLHLLPVSIGFLVWYPVAAGFLMTAHRMTRQKPAVLATAALAAAIKLLNLLLPGRIDRVINPAVSILFEGVAVFAAIYVFEHIKWAKKAGGTLIVSIGMNTAWRVLYLGYLAFLVPDWIREVSVLQSGVQLLRFMAIDNLCSSLIVFVGISLARHLKNRGLKPPLIGHGINGLARILLPAGLIVLNIALQMTL